MEKNIKWLSLDDAAKHLNMGKTKLYELARAGHAPGSKVTSKWIFEIDSLDKWARAYQPIESFFTNIDFNIDANPCLREPQESAYKAISDFFQAGKNNAIVQIPVGCGKSGLASILPFGIATGRVLVLAPNLAIKQGLYEAMDITNKPKCFWRKANVLSAEQMLVGPYVCTLDSGNISTAQNSNIVISNIQQLATNLEKWLDQFPEDFFGMIIVDEAHHSPATSWKNVIKKFKNAKIIYLTATPFRSDRQELEGQLVYRYPFRSATIKGYIKSLKASYVAPSEVELSFTDDSKKIYTLEDVLQLKEETWFSKGIALAKPCNQHIVDNSIKKLEDLRLTGTQHQLIAVACTINHAKEIRSMYKERGYSADVIHSNLSEDDKEKILSSLKNGTLDCIIQVQMLGEGFDHPKLSVAAIFRPFRTLAPYIQFIGRIMRVIVQNNPSHPDNLGYIVTHLGMNLDARLTEFKQFENDDKAFWDKVIGGEDPEIKRQLSDTNSTRTLRDNTVSVSNEIIDSLWEEDFTSIEDKHLIEELKEQLRHLGLDPAQAEEIVRNQKKTGITKHKPADPYPIQPQKQWEEARTRLDEQVKRTAKILLSNTSLDIGGKEIPFKYTSLGITATNNLMAAIKLVNKEVNSILKKERKDCTAIELQEAAASLDKILSALNQKIKDAKDLYEKNKN